MSRLVLAGPCTRADLAEVYGRCAPLLWTCAVRQLDMGPSFAGRHPETGEALFVGGYIPRSDCWEAWFHAQRKGAPLMREALRLTRLTLSALPHSDPRPLETAIRAPAGARIARALGFTRVGAVAGIEVWRLNRCPV